MAISNVGSLWKTRVVTRESNYICQSSTQKEDEEGISCKLPLAMLGHPETWVMMREINYIRQSRTKTGGGGIGDRLQTNNVGSLWNWGYRERDQLYISIKPKIGGREKGVREWAVECGLCELWCELLWQVSSLHTLMKVKWSLKAMNDDFFDCTRRLDYWSLSPASPATTAACLAGWPIDYI